MAGIHILPLAPVNHLLLTYIERDLTGVFNRTVIIQHDLGIPADVAHDASRHQYNATFLLASILKRSEALDGKVIGVTGVDLFIPVLTYVIGEAQLNGKAAVVSTFRLNDELYGLPANPVLLRERFFKEAVHELGHTFGLIHCRQYDCVMRASASVEEIDIKGMRFCDACREDLDEALVNEK